jgi:response regulator RpfG family c-di-GMP phosphodiesterase
VAVVVMVSGLLAMELKFESQKAVKMVGMGALMHDIGLYDLLPDLTVEDPGRLSPADKLKWERHPERGEEMLRAFGGFEEVVYQAVSQHHQRKRGDVGKRRVGNINMVSEIVGMADEFQNTVLEGEFSPQRLNDFLLMGAPAFSPAIEEAMLKVLKRIK